MNLNRRLVDSTKNPLAREVLLSAELDEPPEHSVVRLAVGLGLGSSAIITTAASGASASTWAASAGTAGTASCTASPSVAAGAAVASNVAASTASLAGATSALGAAGAAAPLVGGAMTAVGMLKAMAIVGLTCGALSFGGTKLAMSFAEPASVRPNSAALLRQPGVAPSHNFRQNEAAMPAGKLAATETETAIDDLDDPSGFGADTPAGMATEVRLAERRVQAQQLAPRTESRQLVDTVDAHQAVLGPGEAAESLTMGPVAAFATDDAPSAPAADPSSRGGSAKHGASGRARADVDLDRDVILLQRARRAVAADQPLVALQALDGNRWQAQTGNLHSESVVLRVQALLALGQRSAAERAALPLIRSDPHSRYALRLRGLLGIPND